MCPRQHSERSRHWDVTRIERVKWGVLYGNVKARKVGGAWSGRIVLVVVICVSGLFAAKGADDNAFRISRFSSLWPRQTEQPGEQ